MKYDWHSLAATMRGDLDRADLNGRARSLAQYVIGITLSKRRTRVVIPNRRRFCDLLGIGPTHVAEVIAALEISRILSVKGCADGWEILVYPDASRWEVAWIRTREAQDRFNADLELCPGQAQPELIEAPPSLARTLADVSAENASYQNGKPETPAKPPRVTKTVSPLISLKDSKSERAYSFESFKSGLLMIESRDERQAMEGLRQILGDSVMDNDGGKWRMRWRTNPSKVHRVFAQHLEERQTRKINSTGGHTEYLWKQFAD